MAIDKKNSKPWVKITVWILTFSLMFAFMGSGVLITIQQWDNWFGTNNVNQAQMVNETPDQDEIKRTYEWQLEIYENLYAEDPTDENRDNFAIMSASYGVWLYESGDIADYPEALDLLERSIELNPDVFGDEAQQVIDSIKSELGE